LAAHPVLFYCPIIMKTPFFALAAILTLVTAAFSGDAYTYEGTITGVVCVACKQHVTASLTGKEQISEVKITPGEKEGEQKITIVSGSSTLDQTKVTAALGELAEEYKITSLGKKG
jgi:copper chaperone CopZ